ncbi:HD domain-containing protein [Nonomuraea sp. NPDC046570]|uniref:HD domain-containing protein n=1 Tax=Nonomuraea sp. NPDC046570 TaxID=3155255 RepID=UPI003404DDB4
MSALAAVLPASLTPDQVRTLERAYAVAAYWHRDQTRKSGEPYITHPLAVAAILAEHGADHELLCAALLHDVLDDTACPVGDLTAEFGEEVTRLLTDLRALDDPELRGADWESSTDERVLTLKLADRLHNLRTMRFLPSEKQLLKSRETLDVYLPVADRLGMAELGRELEGLARTRLGLPAFRVLTAGAVLLPRDVRARWLAEWLGELYWLSDPRSRRRLAAELLVGLPRLAATLRGPAFRRGLLAALRWIVRSNLRTWALLGPLIAWMVLETTGLGDALTILITVPPVLAAGVTALRARLRD